MKMNAKIRRAPVGASDSGRGFAANGYAIFRKLLSAAEVAHYRRLLDALRDDPHEPAAYRKGSGVFAQVEGLTQREGFWPLIFHERLLAAVRGILGEEVRYVRHSDLHVDYPRDPKWHRDIEEPIEHLDRRVTESGVPFGVLRAGLYFHDGMVFGMAAGSHRPRPGRTDRPVWWTNLANRALMRVTRSTVLTPPVGPMHWLALDAGDAVLFDIRTIHSGHYPRAPKYAVYLAYGLPNLHSVMHEAQFVAKPAVGGTPMPAALRTRLARAGLHLAAADEKAIILPESEAGTGWRPADEPGPLLGQPG